MKQHTAQHNVSIEGEEAKWVHKQGVWDDPSNQSHRRSIDYPNGHI